MAPRNPTTGSTTTTTTAEAKQEKKARVEGEYLGHIGHMSCYRCKLRGNGVLDPNSNWRLWNADMKVYRDAAGTFAGSEPTGDDERWASKEDEIVAKMERRRKAMIWFSVSEKLREQHLTDLGGRDKSSEDVFFRLWEKVAPEGTPYQPLEPFTLSDQDRADISRFERKKLEGKTGQKSIGSGSDSSQALRSAPTRSNKPHTADSPFEERTRRMDAAARMLKENGIDPGSISPERFQHFAHQPLGLQKEILAAMAKDGAGPTHLERNAKLSLSTSAPDSTTEMEGEKKKKKKKSKSKSKK